MAPMAERDDKSLDLDDVLEIFGKRAEPQAPAPVAPAPRPAPAITRNQPVAPVASLADSGEGLSSDEEALLAAYEKKRREKPSEAPPPAPGSRLAELMAKAQADISRHHAGLPALAELAPLPELGSSPVKSP